MAVGHVLGATNALATDMTIRRFTDAQGVEWRVYSGTSTQGVATATEPAHSGLSRVSRSWLAFDSQLERRRLTPLPPSWQDASAEELERLLHRATVIFKRPSDPGGAA